MYFVSLDQEVKKFPTLREAVAEAKVSSKTADTVVMVEDEYKREQLTYRFGVLQNYAFDTNQRRR